MIIDKQNLFSEDQAVTATAASENVIDMGLESSYVQNRNDVLDMGKLFVQVTEAFNNLTSLGISIQTDDNAAFASPTTLADVTIPLASLSLGNSFYLSGFPNQREQYLRIYYTVNGAAPTTGKMFAGIVLDVQSNGM